MCREISLWQPNYAKLILSRVLVAHASGAMRREFSWVQFFNPCKLQWWFFCLFVFLSLQNLASHVPTHICLENEIGPSDKDLRYQVLAGNLIFACTNKIGPWNCSQTLTWQTSLSWTEILFKMQHGIEF